MVALPNRMIVLAEQTRTAPVVSAHIYVKAGAIYEQEFIGAGLAHYLEHLLAGGSTTTRPEVESNRILGSIGAQTNAATSLDYVWYYINTSRDQAPVAIDLLSDWIRNNVIAESEFQREKEVIQKEFAVGRGSPERVFWKLTQHARFQAHPARHPVIGYLAEFNNTTREQMTAFYQRMYPPNNLLMVVVGDVDPQATVEQIAAFWSDAPARELPQIKLPLEPAITRPRSARGHARINWPRVRMAWPGTTLGGEHDLALDLLATILGAGESSRLIQQIRNRLRLVNTIGAWNWSIPWGKGNFGVDAEVRVEEGQTVDDAMDATRAAVLEQIARVRDQPVTDEELARAKRQIQARRIYSMQSAQGMAGRIARGILSMQDPDYSTRYVESIGVVTAAEVQTAAAALLDPDHLLSVSLLPLDPDRRSGDLDRMPEPPQEEPAHETIHLDNAALIDRLKQKGDAGKVSAVAIEPVAYHTLPNGLRVLLQRNTAVPAVSIELFQPGGLLADEPGREGVAHAMNVLQMRGTTQRDAAQLARDMNDLGATVGTGCGFNTHSISGQCLTDDLPAVLDMVAEVALHPTFPEEEWKLKQPLLLASIKRRAESWSGELYEYFRELFYPDNPWSTTPAGRYEVVASLCAQDLAQFHHQHLGARPSVLAIFGDIDPQATLELVEQSFGRMPADPPVPALAGPPRSGQSQFPRPQIAQYPTRIENSAAVIVGLGPVAPRPHEDFAALLVLARVFSRFPSGWLTEELRSRGPGLAYAVWANQQTGVQPGHFALAFNTTPDKAPLALERAFAVLHRAHAQLIDAEELTFAKASVLNAESMSLQSNHQRAQDAALSEIYGLGHDHGDRFVQQVHALTPARMQQVVHKYLVNPVVVVVSDQPIEESALRAAAPVDAYRHPPT